jgi:methylthioxylose transferase
MATLANVAVTTSAEPQQKATATSWAAVGYASAVALMAVAMIVPAIFGWDVHAVEVAPLNAVADARVGPGTLPAIALGLAGAWWAPRLARSLSWPRLLAAAFAFGVAWMTALATVDGWGGIGDVLNDDNEYLQTARSITDVSATLHSFIGRIPIGSPGQWTVHVAGHPPGALLFFVGLSAIGLGSGIAAGWVVLLLAATTPVAVLVTLRRLGVEDAARLAAPFLVVCPAAIWSAVSADAMFGATAAWGLCCLAFAATAGSTARIAGWGVAAGLILGWCVLLSYGLPLLGVLAVAVLLVGRSMRPLPWAVAGAGAVVVAFALAGFAWWEAFPVLRTRYWAGIASVRPAAYWIWGDLAALCFSAGPVVGASIGAAAARARGRPDDGPRLDAGTTRAVVALVSAAVATIALADLSLMSKAETERIWLPFVPWLLLGTAFLPERWRRPALLAQVVLAVAVQSLLLTPW